MENFIIAVILLTLIVGIVLYLVRQKKKGVKCVGCPYAKQCGDSSGCNCKHEEKHQK